MGWKIEGDFSQNSVKKCVIIAVPHTSWHDFYIGLLIRKIEGVRIHFMGKKELFKWPFGIYFKRVGWIPLDRTPGQNKVEAIAQEFSRREELRLTLAPEGTRKKVTEWKTGFYYIAKAANVPIIMVAFNFAKKKVTISKPFYPTNSMKADFTYMYSFFKGVKGKVPEYSFDPDL